MLLSPLHLIGRLVAQVCRGQAAAHPQATRDVVVRPWVGAVVTADLYYIAGWWGIHAGSLEDSALTLVWPASGIAVAGVLIFGYRTCALLFIASAALNLPPSVPVVNTSWPVISTVLYGLAGATEAALAVALAQRLGRMRSGAVGFLTRALVAFPAAAALGAGFLTSATLLDQVGRVPALPLLLDTWHGVALADFVGMLAVATPI